MTTGFEDTSALEVDMESAWAPSVSAPRLGEIGTGNASRDFDTEEQMEGIQFAGQAENLADRKEGFLAGSSTSKEAVMKLIPDWKVVQWAKKRCDLFLLLYFYASAKPNNLYRIGKCCEYQLEIFSVHFTATSSDITKKVYSGHFQR